MSELQPLIDKVWRHCENKGTRGRTVTLKVKFADFELISRSRTVVAPVVRREELANLTTELLRALFPMKKPVRLLGVSVSGFVGRIPTIQRKSRLNYEAHAYHITHGSGRYKCIIP